MFSNNKFVQYDQYPKQIFFATISEER